MARPRAITPLFLFDPDPCRLVRQVKQFPGWEAAELLHPPDEPGGSHSDEERRLVRAG
jgi:hypothetical protein